MKAILHRFLDRLETYFQRRIDARWQRAAEDAMRRRGRLNFGPPGAGTQRAVDAANGWPIGETSIGRQGRLDVQDGLHDRLEA